MGIELLQITNVYLISVLQGLANGWKPPKEISEEIYKDIKTNRDDYTKETVGFVGFACSYAAKWFGGYCRGKNSKGEPRNYIMEAYRNCMKQAPKLSGISFFICDYRELVIPQKSIIYCDPPYRNTTKYRSSFDHEFFWDWCREKTSNGHNVFVSEYSAPADFECLWSKEINSSLTRETGSKKGTEKLFKHSN